MFSCFPVNFFILAIPHSCIISVSLIGHSLNTKRRCELFVLVLENDLCNESMNLHKVNVANASPKLRVPPCQCIIYFRVNSLYRCSCVFPVHESVALNIIRTQFHTEIKEIFVYIRTYFSCRERPLHVRFRCGASISKVLHVPAKIKFKIVRFLRY